MKFSRTITQLVLLLSSFYIFSQENISTAIITPFQKESLLREKVFVHTNKTSYLINDTIWFTAYVGEDSSNKPSVYTRNLIVNLLDDLGNILQHKIVFIKNGIGKGDFYVDKNLKSGNYYIQAYTNFMQNFGKDNAYIQQISIIKTTKNYTVDNPDTYDVQVFPESGYLLENTNNTLGIKVLNNNKGEAFEAKIINSKGDTVSNCKGNFLGMGICQFHYNENETYKAIVKNANFTKELTLPKALKTGIIFSIDNSDPSQVLLHLKTNKKSIKELATDHLAVLVYRNNYISQAFNLAISNENQTSQDLLLSKANLLYGVNTITLFRNNEPVAERKFFVSKPASKTDIKIEENTISTDSIQFNISTYSADAKPVISQLSISVLSKDSKVFNENQNILSAFLVTPYIHGTIENPAFYFKHNSKKEKDFLDYLLLCQGWTAYSLHDMIQVINPKKQYNFDRGFTIEGKVYKAPKAYKIGLLSKKNDLIATAPINAENVFSFKNVFIYKKDTLNLTLVKKGKMLKRPQGIQLFNQQGLSDNYNFMLHKITNEANANDTDSDNHAILALNKIHEISEVNLGAIKQKKELSNYEKELNIAEKNKEISPSFYKNKKVSENMESTYKSIFEYFTSLGFVKTTNSGKHYISIRNSVLSIKSSYKNPDGSIPPIIYIDNVRYQTDIISDFYGLKQLYMSDIDEISINKMGAGGGADAMGGIIKIYLKKGDHTYYEETSQNLYESLLLQTGYDKAKSYYQPQLKINAKEMFDWIDINWQAALQTDKNGKVSFSIPSNTFSNEYQLIINGFSSEGLLFHTIYKTGDTD